jgi:hypothetical protein
LLSKFSVTSFYRKKEEALRRFFLLYSEKSMLPFSRVKAFSHPRPVFTTCLPDSTKGSASVSFRGTGQRVAGGQSRFAGVDQEWQEPEAFSAGCLWLLSGTRSGVV